MIQKVGLASCNDERRVIVVDDPIEVSEKSASSAYYPSLTPWLDMSIEFSNSIIGKQQISLPLGSTDFNREVAAARTFGFEEHLVGLKRRGLARGGSLKNAVLIADNKVVNDEGLRFTDEFVRHKFLDAVGDLALAGHYVIGQFKGHRSGHRLNNQLLRELFATRSWRLLPISEVQTSWETFVRNREISLTA